MIFKFGVLLFASYVYQTTALPPCVCTRNYQPVCGSDDHTYPNQCMFDCARNSNQALTVAHEGQCHKAAPSLCICTFEYSPVCGTDGQTYSNKCSLGCQTTRTPTVQLKHTGPCEEVKVAELSLPSTCACTRNLKPVCGTDGVTYNNLCLLECAAQNKPLAKKYDGPCEDSNDVKVVEQAPVLPSCACTRNMQPVCGTDGVTYNNLCLLECAAQNKPLAKKSDGLCDDSDTVGVVEQAAPELPSGCACTRNYLPTCGSNGQTYSNPCMLRCAQKNNPELKLAHIGSCGEELKVDTVVEPVY